MTCVIVGKILKKEINKIEILDSNTQELHQCTFPDEEYEHLKEGDSGVFCGQSVNGVTKIKKIDLRKFLNPLYEEDLFENAGRYDFVDPINDPFPALFKELSTTVEEV